jgi:isoleucyl-tRNA synthetase
MNQNPEQQKSENALREEAVLQFWKDNDIFQKTLDKKLPPEADMGEFNFFEGPPTANGQPAIHHVAARSFKDIIPRYKTMRGFSVRRKAGWDTHGLPVELQVEKQLGLKSKMEIETYGVAQFNQKCKESVWIYKDEWEKLTDRMGYWLDMKHPYVTYDNSYIEALWATVKKIDERGHMYRDFRVGPWCTRCGTGLSSHELNQPGAYKDVKDLSVYVKFPIIGFEKAYFLAWTTTPWTLPGNVGLAVGPTIDYVEAKVGEEIFVLAKELVKILPEGYEIIAEHKGSEMVGMKYEPLYPFMTELISAEQKVKLENAFQVYAADFVTTTDGTGIVHTAVMYGADDFELGTKHNLPKFHLVNEEGKFISGTEFLEGRYVKETDENGKPTLAVDIINDLTDRNLLFKKENYLHSYPHCWRCDTPLIYYARTSWYFNMSKLRDQLMAANQDIHWEPDHIRDGRFGEWLDGIKDWAISRDRYWGTPIPVWQNTDCSKRITIGGLADLKKHVKKSGNKYFVMRHGHAGSNINHIWESGNDINNHLTDQGKEGIREYAKNFTQKIDIIIHSPVLRTTETAQMFKEVTGCTAELVADERIREMNPGEKYQGKPLTDYLSQFAHYSDRYKTENPDGENYLVVRKRVMDALHDYEQKYQGKNILIVSHGGPILNMILGSAGTCIDMILDDVEKTAYPKNAEIRELDFTPFPHNENYELDFHKPYIDQIEIIDPETGEKLTRTPEVMDVWFDSGSMPIAQDHKLGEVVNFDPKPANYIAEGVDQTRGWFYTMHAVTNLLHDEPVQAYKTALCMGLLMSSDGTKMSKSRGNVVDPWAMFDKYGADVVRFWFYSVNQPGESKNFDEKALDEVNKKVFNILNNVVSFYELYKPAELPFVNPFDSTNVLDQWILANLQNLSRSLVDHLDRYKIVESARAIREFINELSTWYVRRSRDRFKSDNETDRTFALVTLQYVLEQLSRYMAPFTPFIAENIFLRIRDISKEESVHLTHWHTWTEESRFAHTLAPMNDVRALVTLGLEARAKANIKVRQPLSSITIAMSLSNEYLEILKDELNVKQVIIDENLETGTVMLDTTITDELQNEGEMRDLIRMIQDMRKTADLVPSDRVIVHLEIAEPTWFGTISLQTELLDTVGAEKIEWSSEGNRVKKQ